MFLAPNVTLDPLPASQIEGTTPQLFQPLKKFTFANKQSNLISCTSFPGSGLTFKLRLSALARFRLHFYITIEFNSFHCVRRKTERSRPPRAQIPVRKKKVLRELPKSSNRCERAFQLLKYIVFKFSFLVDALKLSAAMDEGVCARPPHTHLTPVHRNGADAHARTVQTALPQ